MVEGPTSTAVSAICLVGGGGHALVVAEAARLQGLDIVGYFDDRGANCLMQLSATWLGNIASAFVLPSVVAQNSIVFEKQEATPRILAIGDLPSRTRFLNFGGVPYASVLHPSSVVSVGAQVGVGVFVAAGAVVNCNATVDDHAIVNTRAIVEHDCVVGRNVHIGPGAVLGGGVRIGQNTLIGLNASVKPSVSIGENSVVGAGAVVVQDVASNQVVMGVPAKPVDPEQFTRRSA